MTKFTSTPNRCVIVDGKELWISRSITVLAILVVIYDGNAYVPLNKRGPDLPSEVGKWCLAGGYLDYDETIGGAVMREVWEELGLNLQELQANHRLEGSLDQPSLVFSEPRRSQNVTMHYPLMLFLNDGADLPSLEPQVSQGEVTEVGWFTLDAALEMELAFNHQDILRRCLSNEFAKIWPTPSLS
ncbi:MAG: NUDIX hydrolase [Leptolyngbyaceae cyanobacterium MAG.088]|nr:NUDIX hydrolase [Leptolyngbyaceae cyanobacterium MAG.088]